MATENARFDAFTQRMLIAKAPAWMPSKGDVLIAEVIGLSMREGDYGPYPCITYRKLDEDGGVVNLHAFHTMIRERLAELKTDIGSKHMLTYAGLREKTTPNAKGETESYHDYYVEDFEMNETDIASKSVDFTFDTK